MTPEERIKKQEAAFDALTQTLDQLDQAVAALQDQMPLLASLVAYYETDWRADYEADERGELPTDLKRGVLSQDGLYDLINRAERWMAIFGG